MTQHCVIIIITVSRVSNITYLYGPELTCITRVIADFVKTYYIENLEQKLSSTFKDSC